ncbi:MAG: hypothetical protein ACLSVD_07100 [Eggerthellaceae bacterium]
MRHSPLVVLHVALACARRWRATYLRSRHGSCWEPTILPAARRGRAALGISCGWRRMPAAGGRGANVLGVSWGAARQRRN